MKIFSQVPKFHHLRPGGFSILPVKMGRRHAGIAGLCAPGSRGIRGFSLLELMVSVTILLVVMAVLLQITGAIGEIWKSTSGKISAFQNARSAFATITNTLSRATLNTYNDYVQEKPANSGNYEYRTQTNASTFVPSKFMRASELQFISGQTVGLIPGATADINPGHAVFFQAPMGVTEDKDYSVLNRTLNSVGFYIQYAPLEPSILPDWLKLPLEKLHRFRLVQVIEPTEHLKIYTSTATTGFDLDWLNQFTIPGAASQPRPRVLAEDVCLLLIRPRMAAQDEIEVVKAPTLSQPNNLNLTTFDPATDAGSVLCPNYQYDSRAWETGYPLAGRSNVNDSSSYAPAYNSTQKKTIIELMRNQVPPFVDVIMVSLDRRTLNRFDFTQPDPPAVFSAGNRFKDAKKLEADLLDYTTQLANQRIRYKVFRTSVEIEGAKWSN